MQKEERGKGVRRGGRGDGVRNSESGRGYADRRNKGERVREVEREEEEGDIENGR
jgi:hypothetical protein